MCGIAGIVSLVAESPDQGIVRRMLDVMRHRGLDGEGVYGDPQAVLGHCLTFTERGLSNQCYWDIPLRSQQARVEKTQSLEQRSRWKHAC
jgi:asparagine synthetase B (glutamine-hydrolysing)